MRAEPYDLLDTEPTDPTLDTLFVPRFWPDEPDSNNDDGDNYENNYLNDKDQRRRRRCAEEPDEIHQLVARLALGPEGHGIPVSSTGRTAAARVRSCR